MGVQTRHDAVLRIVALAVLIEDAGDIVQAALAAGGDPQLLREVLDLGRVDQGRGRIQPQGRLGQELQAGAVGVLLLQEGGRGIDRGPAQVIVESGVEDVDPVGQAVEGADVALIRRRLAGPRARLQVVIHIGQVGAQVGAELRPQL
ncbi:hypothetical protein D3C86_1346030 [compost metagenome]